MKTSAHATASEAALGRHTGVTKAQPCFLGSFSHLHPLLLEISLDSFLSSTAYTLIPELFFATGQEIAGSRGYPQRTRARRDY